LYHAVQDWELVVLQALRWDVSAVSAADFVDAILRRLSLQTDRRASASERRATVRQNALIYVVLATLGNVGREFQLFVGFLAQLS